MLCYGMLPDMLALLACYAMLCYGMLRNRVQFAEFSAEEFPPRPPISAALEREDGVLG